MDSSIPLFYLPFSDAFFFLFLSTLGWIAGHAETCAWNLMQKLWKNSSGMHGPLLLKASKEIKCWEEVKSWIGTYILVSQFLFFWALFNYIQQ